MLLHSAYIYRASFVYEYTATVFQESRPSEDYSTGSSMLRWKLREDISMF